MWMTYGWTSRVDGMTDGHVLSVTYGWTSRLNGTSLTEFRQPLQVQSHLEMPRILVQLGHTQRT